MKFTIKLVIASALLLGAAPAFAAGAPGSGQQLSGFGFISNDSAKQFGGRGGGPTQIVPRIAAPPAERPPVARAH
jgi:hypothetical protein